MPFQPPANVTDFDRSRTRTRRLYEAWDKRIGDVFKRILSTPLSETDQRPRYPRFYSPLQRPGNGTPIGREISWPGFPRVYDNWVNLEIDPTPENYQRVHQAAEALRSFVIVLFRVVEGGVLLDESFGTLPYLPGSGLQMLPFDDDGNLDFAAGFALEERVQDEYLEWFVERDAQGNVIRITYTAEGPEYWEVLANTDKTLALNLYRKYLGDQVRRRDLFWQTHVACPVIEIDAATNARRLTSYTPRWRRNEYNPHNIWNTRRGAMHLIQHNNSLGAEIRLAADATRRWAFRPELAPPHDDNDRFRLIGCAEFGGINRNSDPRIGYDVNSLMLNNLAVTISDPVGLYISEIQLEGLRDPDGNPLSREDVLTIIRGDDDSDQPRILRFSITPPAGTTYGLQDCTLDGLPLATGGPIARQTLITIYGEGIASDAEAPITPCAGRACQHPDRPNYWQAIGANRQCEDIDWTLIPPPLGLESPAINLVLDRNERPDRDIMERRMIV